MHEVEQGLQKVFESRGSLGMKCTPLIIGVLALLPCRTLGMNESCAMISGLTSSLPYNVEEAQQMYGVLGGGESLRRSQAA